jgi:hypothetical protein
VDDGQLAEALANLSNRDFRGDLTCEGDMFPTRALIDFTISSPVVKSNSSMWNRANTNAASFGRVVSIFHGHTDHRKRSHYLHIAKEIVPEAAHPLLSDDSPLAAIDLDFIPASVTAFGTIGYSFRRLIATFAAQLLYIRIRPLSQSVIPRRFVNSLYFQILREFSSILAVSVARAIGATSGIGHTTLAHPGFSSSDVNASVPLVGHRCR